MACDAKIVMDALKLPDAISTSSSTSSSSTTSTSNEGLTGIRRRLSCRIKKSWSFRKMEELAKRGRSRSDVGVYGIYTDDDKSAGPIAVTPSRSWHATDSTTQTLAQHALQLTLGLSSQRNPVVVEDPPTDSDGSSDGAKLHPSLLIGSTGNFSAGPVLAPPAPPSARSAPASPLQPPQSAPVALLQRSPHHDKSGKQPSWSGGEGATLIPPSGGHKARQKKFHRHFPQAAQDERVLNYYSCALVGDILLQGHLYITKNYFAFYSNVFGYVTKLLIPLSSVVRVSKEKMARIIPNAVGVTTLEDKHVFGSLLSRDTTYKLMTQVWKASPAPVMELSPVHQELRLKAESELSLDEDSSWCSQSGGEDPIPNSPNPLKILPSSPSPHSKGDTSLKHPRIRDIESSPIVVSSLVRKPSVPLVLSHTGSRKRVKSATTLLPPVTINQPTSKYYYLLITAASLLLVLLFFLALMLLYRIVSTQAMDMDDNVLLLKRGDDVYNQILKWHSQLHSKSALQVHEFLHSNMDQIAKVRQSLETLSTLIGGIVTDGGGSREAVQEGGYLKSRENTILPSNSEAQS